MNDRFVKGNQPTTHQMKTTHQIAMELLALPDIPLVIEGWCQMDNHEMVAEITGYSDREAIIWQKPDPRFPPRTTHGYHTGEWVWKFTPTQLPNEDT
jgi:hypothetical protein